MNTVAAAVSFAMRIRLVKAETGTKLNRTESARNWLGDAAAILACQNASIWALQPDGETLKLLVGMLREEESLGDFELRLGQGITGCAARAMQPLAIDNAVLDERHSRRADEILGHVTRQMLSCPMARGGFTGGVVNFLNRRPDAPFSFREADILAGQILAGALVDFCVEAGLVSPRRPHEPPSSAELARAFSPPQAPVFASSAMIEIVNRVRDQKEAPLLILGEPGSGRHHLASMAHQFGAGAGGTFTEVDCRAARSDWEATLFGAARGAAPGIAHDRPGSVESAHRGSLFLNHIRALPLPVQRKLCEFHASGGEFCRMGETRPRRASVRLIAADDAPRRDGGGSEALDPPLADLPWVRAIIPPLRERREDIVPLVSITLRRLAEREGRRVPWLTREAADALRDDSDYPGNVGELLQIVETVYAEARKEGGDSILRRHLPGPFGAAAFDEAYGAAAFSGPGKPERGGEKVWVFSQIEKLVEALEATRCESSGRWNLSSAHRRLNQLRDLGISRVAFAQRVRAMEPKLRELAGDGPRPDDD